MNVGRRLVTNSINDFNSVSYSHELWKLLLPFVK